MFPLDQVSQAFSLSLCLVGFLPANLITTIESILKLLYWFDHIYCVLVYSSFSQRELNTITLAYKQSWSVRQLL